MSEAVEQTRRTHWSGVADDAERDRWTRVAEEVAVTLAADALERDRRGEQPFAESRLLQESGLVNLLDPAELGGGGGHWESAFLVVRVLARADASIAQLLGYHYINSANVAFVAPAAEREGWLRRTIEGRWIWGDSVNPVDPNLVLRPDGAGFRLDGFKRFSTGSGVGEALLVNAVVEGGEHDGRLAYLVLPYGHPGVELVDDWDNLGQRLSASNTVRYHDVRVGPEHVLGLGTDEPFQSLVTPGIQLVFGNLYLGIAQGALAQGRELTLARPNSWFLSAADTYREDPFVQRLYGELVSRVAAVEALADRVNRSFDRTIDRGSAVTADDRAALAIEVAQLKAVSSDTAVDVANRVFEATGSSSTASHVGLDLHWRNARTHSLHDPVDFKKLEVGAHFLTGAVQPISLYT
ncbi:acyl-CoA dehydrogenase family protein [Microbacterium betulae]|uniref:Acyl-CoA dehydrogenase family protein n=1 Tax=Microbacterium betulae TaxID=2981139 RepID=A0AA97FGX9_9MICO|nr:acyl-CoA dehydrogenase family protein [Microbacterium sp. AB]WOF22795.1 acyl-CoA dehydrogenase family protein [Microbacterium sp. AB]